YGADRRVRLAAAERAPPGAAADLVLLAVKTQDVARALEEHRDTIGLDPAAPGPPVVAIQNGLAQDGIVAALCGPARGVAAVAALDASFLEPGVVTCDRRGSLLVGPVGSRGTAAARAAEAVLRDAVDVGWTWNVVGARWTKLVVNLGNVVPALTGLPFQETSRHALLGRAHVRMIREAVKVARADGVTLAPIPWTSPVLLHAAAALPEALAAKVYAARVRRVLGDVPGYGSTWQSVQRGAALETEWLNGEVVRRGKERGVATPANAAACRLAAEGARLTAEDAGRALLGG
ncbi:MAG TPA: ketopantoate reductase C-terminal domain-containing protein, partial [Candidatus Thermoplasmatota archaeon]|nr:ketopantoate reductase C-terminal domain-containing protein [Candidatus Thermoplasmatota archaeon]